MLLNSGHIRHLGDFLCRVHTNLTGQERALELFVPWRADVTDDQSVDWTLTVAVDSERLAELRAYAEGHTAAERLEIFAGETYLNGYPYHDASRLLIDESSPQHAYLVSGRDVTVVVAADEPRFATYGVRAYRELFHRTHEEAGGIMMHAASCATEHGSALIVGGKGAGKTTLMMAGCLAGGASYVANDRVMVVPRGDGWDGSAFPMVCRVHPGTASQFPLLAALALDAGDLARRQDPLFRQPHSDIASLVHAAGPDIKLELAPSEIAELLDVPLVPQAPVRCVLLPQVEAGFDGVEVEPVAPEDAHAILRGQCLTPQEEKWITPWLLRRSRTAEEMGRYAEESLARITRTLPCLRIRYGHGAGAAAQAGKYVNELIGSPEGQA